MGLKRAEAVFFAAALALAGCTTPGRFPANATLRTAGGPLVQAHRGGRAEYDDNALGGFKASIEKGIRGFETDIRFTKDRQLVIMHDANVGRTTDGTGIVEDMTLAEIRACRLKKSGEVVPTLEEVLEVLGAHDDIFVELEMKGYPGKSSFYTKEVLHDYCRKLNATAKRMLKPGTYAFTCFDEGTLKAMRRVDASAPTGFITAKPLDERHIARAKALGCCSVAPLAKTTAEMVARAHDEGLTVCLWMCQDEKALAACAEKGADRVTSDFPARLVKAASARGR
ncbi:MAG: glycerophosphodiester phosphodiesterase [Kiritimatiellae bacterium]|nr:glycerophosphodiester phosphodiesterase [Kiritimatiellia bacterium]